MGAYTPLGLISKTSPQSRIMVSGKPVYRLLFSLFLVAAVQLSLHAQKKKWLFYEVYNGDTINRIDSNNHRQGLWKTWDNNLALVMTCHYKDNAPVGKITYFQKGKTLLEIEPSRFQEELGWRYYGKAKPITGKVRRGKRKVEFLNAKGKKMNRKELKIFLPLLDTEASYVGGYFELFKYFKDNLKYPAKAREQKKQGIVNVSFTVEDTGEISHVTLVSGFDDECNQRALEIVKNMPRWRAATKLGYPIASQQMVPIRFKL